MLLRNITRIEALLVMRKRIIKLSSLMIVAVISALIIILVFAQADMNRFTSDIASLKLNSNRVLTSRVWIDDGWYPAGLRHNFLAVVLGTRGELADSVVKFRSALPKGYTLSVSPPTLFKDYNRRGDELVDYCVVIHVTTLSMVGWFDYGQWLSS